MKIKILPFFWWVAEIVSRKERQLVRSQFFSKIRHYRRQFKIFGGLKSDFEKLKNSNFWRCSRDFKIWSRDQQNFQNFEHTFSATIYNLEIFGILWTASDVGDMMLVTWWCWWHGGIGGMVVLMTSLGQKQPNLSAKSHTGHHRGRIWLETTRWLVPTRPQCPGSVNKGTKTLFIVI